MADVLFPRLLLGEVMADKVSGEVIAPMSGQVRLLAREGQTVREGDVIGRVD
jgi:pyruvate/2-oxoglutarate dehydrogenase complex dihydrolipoamide acyltransferase (E2) component